MTRPERSFHIPATKKWHIRLLALGSLPLRRVSGRREGEDADALVVALISCHPWEHGSHGLTISHPVPFPADELDFPSAVASQSIIDFIFLLDPCVARHSCFTIPL